MTDEKTKDVKILALESSCDETACAVVVDGHKVLSNSVATQIDLHSRFGGVVPEVASRAHIPAVNTVIAEALSASGLKPADLDAIAVTCKPGLVGSLLVALMAAKTLSFAWDKPLIGVNHVHAHAYSPALDAEKIEYPAVALVVSGGHSSLYKCTSPTEVELLGKTIDDAAGEAFDKAAAILELGYPGGPVIDKMAACGDSDSVSLPLTLLKGDSLDFSFSGLKTAVLYHVNGVPNAKLSDEAIAAKGSGYGKGAKNLTESEKCDIAASFQQVVSRVLAIKTRRAVKLIGAKTIIVGGGVAANSSVRAALEETAQKCRCTLRKPPMKYCTDNAAMIGGLAYHHYLAGDFAAYDLPVTPTVG